MKNRGCLSAVVATVMVLLACAAPLGGSVNGATSVEASRVAESGRPDLARGSALARMTGSMPAVSATATVSGTIWHDGNPVPDVLVGVVWEGGGGEDTTGPGGVYSVSSVPTGGWVQVFVRPPVGQRLAFRNWATGSLAGDLAKDFDLEQGYLLAGEFRTPGGAIFGRSFWLETNTPLVSPPEGEWVGDGVSDGRFELVLPQDQVYVLEPNMRPAPYHMPFTKVPLAGDVADLVIALLDEIPPPFPTTPPRASLVTVGEPDVEGYAMIAGAAEAVEPLSAVVIVNLSARTLITTTSDASGAFSASLFAPPGSSLLVKYDRRGDRIANVWKDAFRFTVPDISYLNVLPGTILRVGLPESRAEQVGFQSAGAFNQEQPNAWAGWSLDGSLHLPPGTAVGQGQRVDLDARLQVTAPALTCSDPVTFTPGLHLHLRYLFDADGHSDPWGIWFNAHLFTPTGLPIEHEAGGETVGVGSESFGDLACLSDHAFEGRLEASFEVPASLPDGTYLVEAYVDSGGVPLAEGVPMVPIWYHFEPLASLPPLVVGSPATPRIPWTLLGDYPLNGHRGVQAREDAAHYAMPTRIVYPPHRVVVPRLDERTGKPLVYRLEPGSHWLSATDRRLPNPPHIPLRLPSGELLARVHKPDESVDTIGPLVIRQSSVRTPSLPGGTHLDFGTGHICDLYHLATLDESFAYSFDQYGPHTIELVGIVEDIYGNEYPIEATYDVIVARILDLDPAQLPTTPYVEGDAFAPGLHVFPPVPADVVVELVQMPLSEPAEAVTTTVAGRANRFGYFQPDAGTVITMVAPGEFRVDISATFVENDGTLWAGAMTWGNVVESSGAQIVAHGRRGMDYQSDTIDDMPSWFEAAALPPDKVGIEMYYPYFSGDVHWGDETPERGVGDSIHSIVSIEEVGGIDGPIYNLMRSKWPARSGFRWPPTDVSLAGLNKRLEVKEAPLFMTTASGIDPGVDPDDIDVWGYWYGSSERPDVHVREIISEDNMGTAYWRFDDTYGYQIGEGAKGDLPGDLKWEFGGAVFRYVGEGDPIAEYAIYSSLWVLLPHHDPVGARVTPPFRGMGVLDGGPIMTLQGEEIDMLFLPKGVRPGDVLEVGDMIAFSGHVGPPLASRVSVTITSPSQDVYTATWHANKIGWHYDPGFDFVADEAGRWTVDVQVLHDRPYSPTGITPSSNNAGTVLGTAGQYEVYVVDPDVPRLFVYSPRPGFIRWSTGHIEPVDIRGIAPPGTAAVHYTIHDKGVVMAKGAVVPADNGTFVVTYDAESLNAVFPFVSLTAHEGEWDGLADEVAINLLAVGGLEPRANTVTLIGEEVFIGGEVSRVFVPLTLRE